MINYGASFYCCLLAGLLFASQPQAADWEQVEIPVKPGAGLKWQLQDTSDDFTYTASPAPAKQPTEFTKRWKTDYINAWRGPGNTVWNAGHSYVTDGHLGVTASRKTGAKKISTGIISSRKTYQYPLFIETRAKICNQVLASCVWMLSADSTQEIDVLEAYGGDRPGQEWFAKRLHLSHHVFIREPFTDYQPKDPGSWYFENDKLWRQHFVRVGVYWRDPWHLEYYIDGKKVRTVSGKEKIDPQNHTNGTGLSKAMHVIINLENQDWRIAEGVTPTDKELSNTDNAIMWVDWLRIYRAVKSDKPN